MSYTRNSVFDAIADSQRDKDQAWRQLAACRGRTDLFYPEGSDRQIAKAVAKAKLICAECEVQEECAAHWAQLPTGLRAFGVWSGSAPRDRPTRKRKDKVL